MDACPMPGTPWCHGTPTWEPSIASLPVTRPWGQAGLRLEVTRDAQLSTHGCPDLSCPSSPVLGATEPRHPNTPQPQQPPRGAPSAPWGHGVLWRGTPWGAHVAQHPQPSTLGARLQARWVQEGHEGTWGTLGRWLMALCPPPPCAELHQVHSTPVLTDGPSHVPVTGSGGEWGTDFGLTDGWPQQRGHGGDATTAVMAGGDPRRLPFFSSPKPRRGSISLASGVTRSPATCLRPPHARHPPVTR